MYEVWYVILKQGVWLVQNKNTIVGFAVKEGDVAGEEDPETPKKIFQLLNQCAEAANDFRMKRNNGPTNLEESEVSFIFMLAIHLILAG
ncbi:hypothetical protein L2E82_29725 [Cichorium intybus]|uniref:Uncharacterized protein n=1 Tax=Cichorium intybus TaxID=13427 RepID=A0ACB9CYF0_CICIN|nr:hypothetical protein L2E82_29725 [Cichorium intybus]